jgi:hypothetical protein
MDNLVPLAELGLLVDHLSRESAALRAEAQGAIAESRLLRAESRQHARELRALREERMALLGGG